MYNSFKLRMGSIMGENNYKFTKHGLAIEVLAKYFMGLELNEKIKTITEFEESILSARGTIQNSIKQLCDEEAVTLVSRGKLGTIITAKNTEKLLAFAGISFFVGVMPLPYSRCYEGLSTAILQTMHSKLNMPVNMAYMRGAHQRIEMILNQRYHFAIISKFAAQDYLREKDDIEIVVKFKEGSYLSSHVLLFGKPHFTEIVDGMRVGVDKESIDQTSLTIEATQGKDVTLVDVGYNQLVEKLRSGKIDAAIWNSDDVKIQDSRVYSKKLNLAHKDNTIAVIIIDKRRQELKLLLKLIIDVDEVADLQRKVVEGEIPPCY